MGLTIGQRRVAATVERLRARQGRSAEPTIEQRRMAATAAKIAARREGGPSWAK